MAPLTSHSQSVLPGRNALRLEAVEYHEGQFVLWTSAHERNTCPACGEHSRSAHGQYFRKLQDLPWQGSPVELRMRIRRFRCRNGLCKQKIFSEHIPTVVRPYARRTNRVLEIIRLIGYTTGGRSGSRVLERLAIPTSDDTVLRTLKRPGGCGATKGPVRKLGVDDWAWHKGQNYGTILVDLERHQVVDLLPDRTAESFQAWLAQHSDIEVVSRDRCRVYSEGANLGAPDAVQVADRFHLLVNLSDAIERALEEHRSELQLPALEKEEPRNIVPSTSPAVTQPTQQHLRKELHRQHRLERYGKVTELHRLGYSQKAIAAELNIQRKTVRRWLRAGEFPERKPPLRKRPAVEDHAEHLEQRWNQGCHNATTLFYEIRARGYTGKRGMVAQYVSRWRITGKPSRGDRPQRIAPKHAAILVTKPAERLTEEQHRACEQLVMQCPATGMMRVLAQEFHQALLGRDSTAMLDWIHNAIQSGVGPVVRFAFGLKSQIQSVLAAVTTEWSNGQTEGQVNRLKTIKRQMYGRAGFALLRQRILPFTPLASP